MELGEVALDEVGIGAPHVRLGQVVVMLLRELQPHQPFLLTHLGQLRPPLLTRRRLLRVLNTTTATLYSTVETAPARGRFKRAVNHVLRAI